MQHGYCILARLNIKQIAECYRMSNPLPALPMYINKWKMQFVDACISSAEGSSTLPTRNVESSVSISALHKCMLHSQRTQLTRLSIFLLCEKGVFGQPEINSSSYVPGECHFPGYKLVKTCAFCELLAIHTQ